MRTLPAVPALPHCPAVPAMPPLPYNANTMIVGALLVGARSARSACIVMHYLALLRIAHNAAQRQCHDRRGTACGCPPCMSMHNNANLAHNARIACIARIVMHWFASPASPPLPYNANTMIVGAPLVGARIGMQRPQCNASQCNARHVLHRPASPCNARHAGHCHALLRNDRHGDHRHRCPQCLRCGHPRGSPLPSPAIAGDVCHTRHNVVSGAPANRSATGTAIIGRQSKVTCCGSSATSGPS